MIEIIALIVYVLSCVGVAYSMYQQNGHVLDPNDEWIVSAFFIFMPFLNTALAVKYFLFGGDE